MEEYEWRSSLCSCLSILHRVRAIMPLRLELNSKSKMPRVKYAHDYKVIGIANIPINSLYRRHGVFALDSPPRTARDAPYAALGAGKSSQEELVRMRRIEWTRHV